MTFINPLDLVKKAVDATNKGVNTAGVALQNSNSTQSKAVIKKLSDIQKERDKQLAVKKAQAAEAQKKVQALIDEQAKKFPQSTLSTPTNDPIDPIRSAQASMQARFDPVQHIVDSAAGAYNSVRPALIDTASKKVENMNPLLKLLNNAKIQTPIQDETKNAFTGGFSKVVEQPVKNFVDQTLVARNNFQQNKSKNSGDYINSILGTASRTGNLAMNAIPLAAQYNAATGALQGNERTKGIGDVADAVTGFLPGQIANATNMLPISRESKDVLNTLVNLGLIKTGSKLGEKAQARINDVGYKATLMDSLNKNLAREGTTFTSGPNFSPIIKAIVDAEKSLVKNKAVQALDPTGFTSGAGQSAKINEIDYAPKGYGVDTVSHTVTPSIERLKGETLDQAIARKVNYQIDNGIVDITQDTDGWKATIQSTNGPKTIRAIKKQQLLNETYKYLNPDYSLPKLNTDPNKALDPTGITTGAVNVKASNGGDGVPPIPPKNKGTASDAGNVPSPEEVGATLHDKLDNLIQKTAGYTIKTPDAPMKKGIVQKLLTPFTKVNDAYTGGLRKLQDAASTKLEDALTSKNPLARNAATSLQGFFRGSTMSPAREAAGMKFKGGLDSANTRAYDVMDSMYKVVKNDKKSLERINAVLDPELAKTKVSFEDLTPPEKQAYGLIREGFDLVHDTSYANGHITPELYQANKGKYTPRMYDVFELPDEIGRAVQRGTKKFESDLYKSREGVDNWKAENSLNDPVYSLGKRLAQVESNRTIKQYTDYIAKNTKFVSDVEKPGYTKLGDSKAYGDLAGKFVLNNIAEDFKGYFFANEGLNKVYDALKVYDGLTPRQWQKKALTVYNPTTHLGNIVSDNVFGFMVGVDPLTLNKNVAKLKINKNEYKQIADYLTTEGILGTSIVRGEFTKKLGEVDTLAKNQNQAPTFINKVKSIGRKVDEKITGAYGGTDDIYKVAAFKSLIDQGKSLQEATRLVSDGFQNYSKVGKFYDVYAKTPIVGSAFVKFQGDLLRMIKNAAVNRPGSLVGFLGGLNVIANLSSQASGESPEDKETREKRFGAPYIPLPKGVIGVDGIPLTWQTPIGEINVARYIAPFYQTSTGDDAANSTALNKFVPFGNLIDAAASTKEEGKPRDAKVGSVFSDPFLGPLVQAFITQKDFRGKSILDKNENKYQGSTATDEQKNASRLNFLTRSYSPAFLNSARDTVDNLQGKPDYYDKERSPAQAIARLLGIKVEQFGKEQIEKKKTDDLYYEGLKQDSLKKDVSKIIKDKLDGKITEQMAIEQLEALKKEATFSVDDVAKTSETNKLTEKEKLPKSASQIKSEIKGKAKNAAVQKVAERQIEEMITIIQSNDKSTALTQLKAKYPRLSADAIKKLFVKAGK